MVTLDNFTWLAEMGKEGEQYSLDLIFEDERKESILLPSRVITGMLVFTAIPTLILGIYWVPVADWIENSLVFFIQTI